jgi:hypothetical protein
MLIIGSSEEWMKKRDVTGGWTEVHNEKTNNYYKLQFVFYPNLFKMSVIKSRRLKWARFMSHMGETTDTYRVVVGKCEGRT